MENYNDNKYNDLLYVNCYAKKYNMCNSISRMKNGMCDKCHKDINRNLTEKELFDNFITIKPIIVDSIKTLLKKCDEEVGKNNKAKEVLHIFDLIYHNIYFTILHIKFIKTYIRKIIDLIQNDISTINNVVDEQLKFNETYIDILDFMININDYYKNKIKLVINDDDFLLEYNNFMKNIYNCVCEKSIYTNSLNNKNINEEEKEVNIYNENFYNTIKLLVIDV